MTGRLIRPAVLADADALASIYDPLVRDTHISFETEPPGSIEIARRLAGGATTHPWIVMVEGRQLIGYAHAAAHRARSGYRWAVETSVYVHPEWRNRGVGSKLYESLLRTCREWGYMSAYAGIALPNPASERLHAAAGFTLIGVFPRVGYKLGRWHDVAWWHIGLSDDPTPRVATPGPPDRSR